MKITLLYLFSIALLALTILCNKPKSGECIGTWSCKDSLFFQNRMLTDSVLSNEHRWNGTAYAIIDSINLWQGRPNLIGNNDKAFLYINSVEPDLRQISLGKVPLKEGCYTFPNDSISIHLIYPQGDDVIRPTSYAIKLSSLKKSFLNIDEYNIDTKTLKARFVFHFEGYRNLISDTSKVVRYSFTDGALICRISNDEPVRVGF